MSRAVEISADQPKSTIDRFWGKVEHGPQDHCWPWKASRYYFGHGKFFLQKPARRNVRASRFAYAITNGGVPEGLNVLHRCDNPPCCNPAHLFLGTINDNTQDAVAKNRHAFGEKIGNSKLTESQVLEIRKDPRVSQEIAADYNIHRSMVGYIKNRKNWRHI